MPVSSGDASPWISRRGLIAALLALVLAAGTLTVVLGQALGPAGPSPAQGHAEVIAHGSVAMNGQPLSWSVTAPIANASSVPATVGQTQFILANGLPLLLTDTQTGRMSRLADGEAALLYQGQTVQIQSAGPPQLYFAIGLLSGNASNTGVGLAYISQPFTPQPGMREINLIRDVLKAKESTQILGGAAPTLVLVTKGEVTVKTSSGSTTVRQGQPATFDGGLTLTAGSDDTQFVAAWVGGSLANVQGATPAVPATPVATPAPSPTSTPSPSPSPTATPSPTPSPTPLPTQTPTPSPTPTATPKPTMTPTPRPSPTPTVPTSARDTDGDGLSDVQEAKLGTDPKSKDTDQDGIADGQEVAMGLNPLNLDTDGDTLYDGGELVYGTNPKKPDTDGDGLSDGQEVYVYKTDPLKVDTDGDGVNDGTEVNRGTDPLDAKSA